MDNYSRVMTAVCLPLIVVMLVQGGSCRNSNMNNVSTRNSNMNNMSKETTGQAAAGKTDHARAGTWGGKDISVSVTDSGATIEYSCAEGTISQPIVLDANGNFDVKGVYVAEHGGPTRVGEDNSHPARYSGRIDGNKMTLTVMLTDTKEIIGTYTLTYGALTQLVKCM